MEWVIGAVLVIGVFAFAQLAGNAITADSWEVLAIDVAAPAHPERPSAATLAGLQVGDDVVAFIARAGHTHPALMAILNVIDVRADAIDATFSGVREYSSSWTADDHAPPHGTAFNGIAKDRIFKVYALGETRDYAPDPFGVKI